MTTKFSVLLSGIFLFATWTAWANLPCAKFLQPPFPKEYTLGLVRPEAMPYLARIENTITRHGLKIELSAPWVTRSLDEKRYYLEAFYQDLNQDRYFPLIIGNMLKGDNQILVISGENAVARFQELVGDRDPYFAAKGTLRQAYGKDVVANGIHASANVYAAAEELDFFVKKIPWSTSKACWQDIEKWHQQVATTEFTLGLIKPEAVKAGNAPKIMRLIKRKGLRIVAAKQVQLQKAQAEEFYQEHQGKPFFNDLVAYMTSDPIYILMIAGKNAVAKYREVLGVTDPRKAAEGTIRGLYGTNKSFNAAHGSDSLNSALRELKFYMQFFTSTGEKAAVAPVRAYIDHVVKAEYTLALFSPDAMQGTSASSVARMLAEQGLEVVSMPALHFDAPTVERFFQAQATMEDAIGFVNYMSSHPLYALIIRAPAAVERLKKLLGHPQQDLAAPGTIRQMLWPKFSYPQAVYGSASAEQGQKDVDFILSLMAPQDAQAVERDFRPYQQRNFAQAN